MNDSIDFMFPQRSLEQGSVRNVAADNLDAIDQTRAYELALRNPIAYEADDIGFAVDQPANQRPPYQARCPSNKCWPVAPERGHCHVFQGARPSCHKLCNKRLSRNVSMHCQKPSCRYATSSRSEAKLSSTF